jgi:hypothetical protein
VIRSFEDGPGDGRYTTYHLDEHDHDATGPPDETHSFRS